MLHFKGGVRLLFLLSMVLFVAAWTGCSDDEETGPTETTTGNISGLITVRCTPDFLGNTWTLTAPDGTLIHGEGSAVLEDMPSGAYQISWGEVEGWRSPHPDPLTQELTSIGTLDFPGVYQLNPGSLHIRVLPAGTEARWTLEDSSGDTVSQGIPNATVTGLVTGRYTLLWEQFDHFTAEEQEIDLHDGSHGLVAYGSFSPEDGYLMLVPSPAGIMAPWTVTNTAGASFSGTGTDSIRIEGPDVADADFFDYTVTWGDLDGYTSPDETQFLILEADTLDSYLISPEYVAEPAAGPTGSITVTGTIGSSALNWMLTGPSGFSQEGAGNATLTSMEAGGYTLTWLATPGWSVPGADTADLADGGSLSFTAQNDPAISINVVPDGLAGTWQVSGPGGYSESGVGSAFLEPGVTGSFTLTWGDVGGWSTPAAETLNMTQTQGLIFNGTYTREDGNLFVQTYPENLVAGWTLTGPEGYSHNGTGQEALQLTAAGTYRIVFSPEAGYLKPASRYFTVEPGASMTLDGTYLPALAFVSVAPTTYTMGSPTSERCRDFDEYQHSVELTNTFSIMETEVTNGEYAAVANWAVRMGHATLDGHFLRDNLDGSMALLLDLGDGDHDLFLQDGKLVCDNPNFPVREVTWFGAVAFCEWLSLHQNLPRAYDRQDWQCNGFDPCSAPGYRLPTEAEWELAARAGTSTAFANGSLTGFMQYCTSSTIDEIAWWSGNSGLHPHVVGELIPNDWGLYDMHGNVAEWCNDWFDAGYYQFQDTGAIIDPPGPTTGETKVVRGGYFYSTVEGCRSAERQEVEPETASFSIGFRAAIRRGE